MGPEGGQDQVRWLTPENVVFMLFDHAYNEFQQNQGIRRPLLDFAKYQLLGQNSDNHVQNIWDS